MAENPEAEADSAQSTSIRGQSAQPHIIDPVLERFMAARPTRDDAYYQQVRDAIGPGQRTLLLGTSSRALARAVDRVRKAQGAVQPAEAQQVRRIDLSRERLGPRAYVTIPMNAAGVELPVEVEVPIEWGDVEAYEEQPTTAAAFLIELAQL